MITLEFSVVACFVSKMRIHVFYGCRLICFK